MWQNSKKVVLDCFYIHFLFSLKSFFLFLIFTLFKISFCTVEKSGFFSVQTSLALQPTALKSTNWRFSGLNHPNFGFFDLVPKSPTHTILICVKTPEPTISSLGLCTYTVLAPTNLAPMFLWCKRKKIVKSDFQCSVIMSSIGARRIIYFSTQRRKDRGLTLFKKKYLSPQSKTTV